MTEHATDCLVCGAPLVYSGQAQPMACALCGAVCESNARCENGHYVCDACHEKGALAVIAKLCLADPSPDPLHIAAGVMRHPAVHMHGPEHHAIAGAALLTAYARATGDIDLGAALAELLDRGQKVPGGVCGFWGVCGAAISCGIYLSVLTGATPLSVIPWKLCNELTSRCLAVLAKIGGPRCCKRVTYLCIRESAAFTAENFGVSLPLDENFRCEFHSRNRECIRQRCPYYPR